MPCFKIRPSKELVTFWTKQIIDAKLSEQRPLRNSLHEINQYFENKYFKELYIKTVWLIDSASEKGCLLVATIPYTPVGRGLVSLFCCSYTFSHLNNNNDNDKFP